MKIWKKLIIPAAIFVVLLAVLIVVKMLPQGESSESTASVTSAAVEEYVLSELSTNIEKLTVFAEDGSSFSMTTNGYAEADGAALWTYENATKDTTGYNFSMDKLNTFVNIFQDPLKTSTVVDTSADLAEYGLDTPSYTVQYKMKDGTSHELKIGDLTFEGRYVYCMIDNDPAVYTTYKIIRDKCAVEPIEFLDTMITKLESEEVVYATFSRKSDNLNLVAEQRLVAGMSSAEKELGWVFIEPFNITASTAFTSLIKPMFQLEVSSFEEKNVTDFSKYGLDDPEYRFSFTLKNGQKKEILLSKDMGGIYYGLYSDTKDVFSINSEVITGLQTPPLELIKAYTCYEFIFDVSKIEAKFPEGSFVMDISVPKENRMPDPESSLKLDGVDAKVADSTKRLYYANLYEAFSTIEISALDFDAVPTNTKDISIKIQRVDGTSITVDLAIKDKNTYYAFIDGKYEGFLVDKDQLYEDKGANLYDYGIWPAYQRTLEAIAGAKDGIYDIAST